MSEPLLKTAAYGSGGETEAVAALGFRLAFWSDKAIAAGWTELGDDLHVAAVIISNLQEAGAGHA